MGSESDVAIDWKTDFMIGNNFSVHWFFLSSLIFCVTEKMGSKNSGKIIKK